MDSEDENELGVLEFIHCLVETLDKVLDNDSKKQTPKTLLEFLLGWNV